MAMFKTHIHGSTILGVGLGVAAKLYGLPTADCLLGAGLCSIGGILPDIDSGPGIPLRETTTLLAAVVPSMLLGRFLEMNLAPTTIVLIGAGIYLAIRYGVATFLRHYTVHRGMFHSFPTMLIFGELTYLAFYSENQFLRYFLASAVMAGFLLHLLLDEIYSVEWNGVPRTKRSFGTAMKFFGEGWWPNLTAYGKMAVLTYICFIRPDAVQQLANGQGDQIAKDLTNSLKDRLGAAFSLADRDGNPSAAASAGGASPLAPQPRPGAALAGDAGSMAGSSSRFAWPGGNTTASAAPASNFTPPPAYQPPAAYTAREMTPVATRPATHFNWPGSSSAPGPASAPIGPSGNVPGNQPYGASAIPGNSRF